MCPLREDKIVRLLEATLDSGEAEAIALALELQADVVLLDETMDVAQRRALDCGLLAYSECYCRPRKRARVNW